MFPRSSQQNAVRVGLLGFRQRPVELHVQAVSSEGTLEHACPAALFPQVAVPLQTLQPVQTTDDPPQDPDPLQTSVCVQALPSSQEVPAAEFRWLHFPETQTQSLQAVGFGGSPQSPGAASGRAAGCWGASESLVPSWADCPAAMTAASKQTPPATTRTARTMADPVAAWSRYRPCGSL